MTFNGVRYFWHLPISGHRVRWVQLTWRPFDAAGSVWPIKAEACRLRFICPLVRRRLPLLTPLHSQDVFYPSCGFGSVSGYVFAWTQTQGSWGWGGEREREWERELELENFNTQGCRKHLGIRSIWTYLTDSSCYTTNTNKHDCTTNTSHKQE